ncbi:MAG TPA: ROK family protein [Polyangiaceae bacterium]|nr:ROK family protein [Polyangiaceae bacterium]
MAADDVSIGVDLGGTKIEAVVFDRRTSTVVRRERVETHRERGYEAIVATTAQLIGDIARGEGIDIASTPIGVGMPGSVGRRTGLVKNSNTVCLNGRPFRDDLAERVGRPIAFANDANCFALAEARLGAAKPYVDGVVFGVIMGSGVGGGVVVGGKVWPGLQNIAGEWGHHAVGSRQSELGSRPICYCGQTGCVELYLGGPFIEAAYKLRTNRRRDLAVIAERRQEDADAAAVLDEALDAFGRGLANVIDILDPTAVVLGGGVSNLEFFYTEGVERVKNYVFNDELATPILRHAMGDSAGVLGAALLDGN